MEEDVQRVIDFFLVVVGAVVGAVVSYPLGVRQGKRQIRYEESVRVLREIRKRLLGLRDEMEDWVSVPPKRGSGHADRTMEKLGDLRKYYEEGRVFLSGDFRGSIEELLGSFDRERQRLEMNLSLSRLGGDEERERDERYKAGLEAKAWLDNEFSPALADFENRLQKVLGG